MNTASIIAPGLRRLEAWLTAETAPPDRMSLSMLDGYLTALAVGPDIADPDPVAWQIEIFGGDGPDFASDAEAEAISAAMDARGEAIQAALAQGLPAPIFDATEGGELRAEAWAQGFARALALNAEAWMPIGHSRPHALAMAPIMTLAVEPPDGMGLEIDPALRAELRAKAPELIPRALLKIAEFWQGRRLARAGLGSKPGRNEPCPCGSGKKFKKCCGA